MHRKNEKYHSSGESRDNPHYPHVFFHVMLDVLYVGETSSLPRFCSHLISGMKPSQREITAQKGGGEWSNGEYRAIHYRQIWIIHDKQLAIQYNILHQIYKRVHESCIFMNQNKRLLLSFVGTSPILVAYTLLYIWF